VSLSFVGKIKTSSIYAWKVSYSLKGQYIYIYDHQSCCIYRVLRFNNQEDRISRQIPNVVVDAVR